MPPRTILRIVAGFAKHYLDKLSPAAREVERDLTRDVIRARRRRDAGFRSGGDPHEYRDGDADECATCGGTGGKHGIVSALLGAGMTEEMCPAAAPDYVPIITMASVDLARAREDRQLLAMALCDEAFLNGGGDELSIEDTHRAYALARRYAPTSKRATG